MEIKIIIDDRLVRGVKKVFSRRVLPFVLAVVLSGVSVVLLAEDYLTPFVFKSGEVISASQMNANFAGLETRINALQDQVDDLVAGSGSLWISSSPDIYYTGGDVGIGTATPASLLEVDGIITAPMMMTRDYNVTVSGGAGYSSTSVSVSTWNAFVCGVYDIANVSVARRRYWVENSGGNWRVYVNYENGANVTVQVKILFIRKDLFVAAP